MQRPATSTFSCTATIGHSHDRSDKPAIAHLSDMVALQSLARPVDRQLDRAFIALFAQGHGNARHPVCYANGDRATAQQMELMYQEILRESRTLVNRIEEMAKQQGQIQQAIQAAPVAIRQAGHDATNQAADHAARALLEATRSIASATSDLRVAAPASTSAVPTVAWRTGLLCAVSAFFGSVVCAAVIVLL